MFHTPLTLHPWFVDTSLPLHVRISSSEVRVTCLLRTQAGGLGHTP